MTRTNTNTRTDRNAGIDICVPHTSGLTTFTNCRRTGGPCSAAMDLRVTLPGIPFRIALVVWRDRGILEFCAYHDGNFRFLSNVSDLDAEFAKLLLALWIKAWRGTMDARLIASRTERALSTGHQTHQ